MFSNINFMNAHLSSCNLKTIWLKQTTVGWHLFCIYRTPKKLNWCYWGWFCFCIWMSKLQVCTWNSPMRGCQLEKLCFLKDNKWVLAFPAWTQGSFARRTQRNPLGYTSTALSCCMSQWTKISITHPATHIDLRTKRKEKKKRENQFVLAAGWFSKAANLHSAGGGRKQNSRPFALWSCEYHFFNPHPRLDEWQWLCSLTPGRMDTNSNWFHETIVIDKKKRNSFWCFEYCRHSPSGDWSRTGCAGQSRWDQTAT